MIRVYFASKLSHVELAKKIREEWKEIHFTSRWPFYVGQIPNEHPHECTKFWKDDEEDVRRADVVLVYAEPKDILRGALVEAGIAIALKKLVIVVGENDGYGSWQYHERVRRVDSLSAARTLLRLISVGGQKDGY